MLVLLWSALIFFHKQLDGIFGPEPPSPFDHEIGFLQLSLPLVVLVRHGNDFHQVQVSVPNAGRHLEFAGHADFYFFAVLVFYIFVSSKKETQIPEKPK